MTGGQAAPRPVTMSLSPDASVARLRLRDEVQPAVRRLGDLVGEHLRRPRVVGEQLVLKRDDVDQVRWHHRSQPRGPVRLLTVEAAHHGVTRLGVPGSRASGRRR